MAQDVGEPVLGEPVDAARDDRPSAELGRDHDLALVLGLDRQQATARDVDVQEVVVGVPGEHAGEHRLPLRGVVDDVHVRAREEVGRVAAGVDVDDGVGHREEDARQVVGELLVGRPGRRPRERAIEVRARRPQPRPGLRRGGRQARDDDDPPGDLLRRATREPAGAPRSGRRTRRRGCRRGRGPSARTRSPRTRSGCRSRPSPPCSTSAGARAARRGARAPRDRSCR